MKKENHSLISFKHMQSDIQYGAKEGDLDYAITENIIIQC